MTSFSAMAGIGVGLTQLFGFDDEVFSDSMQKLTSLLLIVKSFETLAEQWQSNEGLMGKLFKPMAKGIDIAFENLATRASKAFTKKWAEEAKRQIKEQFRRYMEEGLEGDLTYNIVANSPEFMFGKEGESEEERAERFKNKLAEVRWQWEQMTDAEKEARYVSDTLFYEQQVKLEGTKKKFQNLTNAVKLFGKVLLTLGGIFATFVISELLDKFTDFVKSLNTAKIAADAASEIGFIALPTKKATADWYKFDAAGKLANGALSVKVKDVNGLGITGHEDITELLAPTTVPVADGQKAYQVSITGLQTIGKTGAGLRNDAISVVLYTKDAEGNYTYYFANEVSYDQTMTMYAMGGKDIAKYEY